MNKLKLIKKSNWAEVFELWRKDEEKVKHWKSFWESKGFTSWAEWRMTTHRPLFENEIEWRLFKVENPTKVIPEWYGIMSYSWNKWFYDAFEEKPPKLKDLVAHPGVSNHWFIREIKDNFAKPAVMLALQSKNGEIMIAEGMHRACALAMADNENKKITTDLIVALGKWPKNKWPKFGSGWNKKQ